MSSSSGLVRGRVSIPSSAMNTIENIKEITGLNHTEDEIYALLQECSMDPNETAQKLLLLDTFHEVKKKRYRRKENLTKESRWNPNTQVQMNRPARWNYSSRHAPHDPILLQSQDVPLPSVMGTIGQETGSKHTPVKLIAENTTERKSASGVQQMASDFQRVGKTQYAESVQIPSSTIDTYSDSRPSPNYKTLSQVVGPQKVGPDKEWKAPSADQGASTTTSSEGFPISGGSRPESQQTSEKATRELHKKLKELSIYDSQNVIIPNHLQVPDAGKFCFGSFDASFGLDMDRNDDIGGEKSPLLSCDCEANEEPAKELNLSNETVLEASENTGTKYLDNTQSLERGPEDFSSGDFEVSPSTTPCYDEPNQEITPGNHQHPGVHTYSYYNYAFMPSFATSESQARDVPRHPGFIVQQPFDQVSYYNQFYRADSEGGISHLQSSVATNDHNGNAALLSTETSQSPQEVATSPVLSMPSPLPLATQASSLTQSSISAAQQPPPVFRHQPGVHLPYYTLLIPCGPYFSPYYVPQPANHQYLSTSAFPIQTHGGNVYPFPPGSTAKYSVPRYNKQGSNTGSSTHIGVLGSYGQYGIYVPNYSSSPVTTTSNEDRVAPEGKENNKYLTSEQKGNPGVGAGQVAFRPTQPSNGGPFIDLFHPGPPLTTTKLHPLLQQSQPATIPVDLVGPTTTVYQPTA